MFYGFCKFYIIGLAIICLAFFSCQMPATEVEVPVVQQIQPQNIRANTIKIDQTIKYGETLSTILKKNDIEFTSVQKIITAFRQIYDVRRLRPREPYTIEKDTSGTFVRFSYKPSVETEYIVCKEDSNTYSSKVVQLTLEKKIKSIKGIIQTSLYDAVLECGESPELLISFTDIFQWDVDFFIDPRVGDEFKIVYEAYYLPNDSLSPVPANKRFVRYGRILTAQYTLEGNELTAIYFNNEPGDDGYYTTTGESFQKTFLKSPLNYRRISSYFSLNRRHPILKIVRPHYGVDFAAPTGTPVSAAADGVIIKKGYERGIGRYIKIRHKNPRFVTLYGHLSRYGKGIKVGKKVKQKDVIGYVGKTGLATGPHLHYTFYDNGRPIDPLKIKNTSGDPIAKKNILAFIKVRDEMLDHLIAMDAIPLPLVCNQSQHVHFNRYLISER